jgi:hypothetical protein
MSRRPVWRGAEVLTGHVRPSSNVSPTTWSTACSSRSRTRPVPPTRSGGAGRAEHHRCRSAVPAARAGIPAGPGGACRPLRLGRPLRSVAGSAVGGGAPTACRRLQGRAVRRRQQHRRPRGGVPRRSSAGSGRTPTCCCPAPAVGSCSAAWSRRLPSRRRLRRWPTVVAVASAVSTPVPPVRHRRPGCDRRAPLPGVGVAEAGGHPSPPEGSGRRPHLRLRRLPDLVPTHRAAGASAPAHSPGRRRPRAWLSVVELLTSDDIAVMATWGRWYLADRDPRWVRRNALVVLGNVGDGTDAAIRAVLADYLAHDDPMKHLLVTNDFPPKIGGIQSLLWEWWRRLPPDSFAVLTSARTRAPPSSTPHNRSGSNAPASRSCCRTRGWSGASTRSRRRSAPTWWCSTRRCRSASSDRRCACRTTSCCTAPRSPCPAVCRSASRRSGHVLRRARHIVAAGGYPADEAEHAAGRKLPITVVPPGVDVERFHPLTDDERLEARAAFGLPADAELIVAISRLVPRKGFDTAIRAAAKLKAQPPRAAARDRRRRPRRGTAQDARRRR